MGLELEKMELMSHSLLLSECEQRSFASLELQLLTRLTENGLSARRWSWRRATRAPAA